MGADDKGMALLLAGGKPAPGEGESTGDDLLLGVADDLLAAIAAKDSQGVADALRAAHGVCQDKE